MYHKSFGGGSKPSQFTSRKKFGSVQKNAPSRQKLNVSRFVKKAVPVEKQVEFVPKYRFEDFSFDGKLKQNIVNKGYVTPTPIQDEAMPHIIKGRDVVGIANTGTGKTAAFLLPLIQKILINRGQKVLIIAPTRELAQQIQQEFIGFAHGLSLYSALLIGGASMGFQIGALRRNPHFIIGTPGRMKDLIARKVLRLENCRSVVLDEADRMLDMGFIQDIKMLLAMLPKERHTLFFSATISSEIENLIQTFLINPVMISVKSQETAENVEQDVIRVPNAKKRIEVLQELLVKKEFNKVLIFGRTKRGVEHLFELLEQRGFRVASIHGDKSQSKRQLALDMFKAHKIQILVATDVAARGLDIPDVSHVINYDIPSTYDDYVHRIGRTGRAEKRGKALTFID